MFNKTKDKLRSSIEPSQMHIKFLKEDINTRLAHLMKHRDVSEQKVLEQNFLSVLQAWGIEEYEIHRVITVLRIRLGIFLLPLLIAVLVIWQAGASVLTFVVIPLCLTVSVMGIVTTMWRIKILTSRRFIPFRHWLWGSFLGLTKKQA